MVFFMGDSFIHVAAENIDESTIEDILRECGLFEYQAMILGRIKEFLRYAIESGARGISEFAFIVGSWGQTKSFVGRAVEKAILQEGEFSGVNYTIIHTKNMLFEVSKKFKDTGNIVLAFTEYFRELIDRNGEPLIVFIDDLESLLSYRRLIIDMNVDFAVGFAEFLRCMINRTEKICVDIRGKVHFLLATTPPIYQRFHDILQEYLFSGWLERREVLSFRLRPILRIEFFERIEWLSKRILKKNPDAIFGDRRLLEHIYTLTMGNPGAIMQQFIRYSRDTKNRSVKEIWAKLRAETILSPEQKAVPLFSDIALPVEDSLLFLIISTSAIYEDEPQFDYILSLMDKLEREYSIRLARGEAFIFTSLKELNAAINELISYIAPTDDPDTTYSFRIALCFLTHWHPDGYAFVLPERIDDLLFFLQQLNLERFRDKFVEGFLRYARGILKKKSRRVIRAVYISPSSYPMLYPAFRVAVIPFVISEDSSDVFNNVMEISTRDPARFSELIGKAFVDVIRSCFGVEVKAHELYIFVPRERTGIRVGYRIPTEVHVVVGDPKIVVSNINKNYSELKMYVILAPDNVTVPRRKWNFLVLELTLRDLVFLAAKSYIENNPRYKDSLIAEKWEEFVTSLINRYHIKERIENWIERGIEAGVILPPEPKHSHMLETRKTKGDVIFFSRYKLLLTGGNNFTLEQLLDLLFKIYSSRPFGRDTWCDAKIPTVLPEDIEPTSLQGRINREKFFEEAKSTIMPALNIAVANRMATISGDGKISLELHPAEKRILRILRDYSGRISRDNLRNLFIFLMRGNRSETRLLDNLIDILSYRGLIRMSQRKVITLIKDPLSRELEMEEMYNRFREAVRNLTEMLDKLGIPPELRSIENGLLHVLVAKKKGWKLILLRQIVDAVEALRARYMDCRAPSVLVILKDFFDLAFKMLSFIRGALETIMGIVRNTDTTLRELNNIRGKIREELRNTLNCEVDIPGSIVETLEDEIRRLSLRIHEYPRVVTVRRLISEARSTIGQKYSETSEVWNIFMFNKGCGSFAKFNMALYLVNREYEEFRRRSGEYLRNLQQILSLLEDIKLRLRRVPDENTILDYKKRIRNIFTDASSLSGILDGLKSVLRGLDNELRRVAEISELRREKVHIEKTLREIFDTANSIERTLEKYREVLSGVSNLLSIDMSYLVRIESDLRVIKEGLGRVSERLTSAPLSRNLIEDVKEEIIEAMDKINSLKTKLLYFRRSIGEIIKNGYIDPLNRQIEIFRGQIGDIEILNDIAILLTDMKRIDEKIEDIKIDEIPDIIRKLKDLRMRWQGIKRRCMEYLSRMRQISQTHISTLELLLSEFADRELQLGDLIEELINRLRISQEDALKIIFDLERKGFIRITLRVRKYP